MKRHIVYWTTVLVALATLVFAAEVPADSARDGDKENKRKVVQIEDARLKFEINATAQDGGIQVFLDADPWKWMTIFDPKGRKVFQSVVSGSIGKQGGTELFLESGEPEFSQLSIEQLLKRFPAGKYRFKGRGLEGERLVGRALLTHNLPDGPVLVSPLEGEGFVDPNNAVVIWEPVKAPNGSPIAGYQVLVVKLESSFPAIPKITLDVTMPATATSMIIPPGFLVSDAEYEWEVLAIEAGGNQTLSTSFFKTAL